MHRLVLSIYAFAGAFLAFAPAHPPARSGPAAIAFNDNRRPAGALAGGALTASLEMRRGDWRPLGADHPGLPVMAFADAGARPVLPGPALRAPRGPALR